MDEKDRKKAEEEALKKEIWDRFIQSLKDNGIDKAARLAEVMDSPHATANNYFGGRLPTLDKFSLMVPVLEKSNIRWILTGNGNKRRDINTGNIKLSAFDQNEILSYINDNKELFKSNPLTKNLFDAMFLEERFKELEEQKRAIKEIYEKRYGSID
ncbi:MAG: hypothetical protein NXH86_04230 [Flavobacteriaceae bacterium]|nr:hypothetical protein [Flavobacteriaceae bacterium]